jgi:hypothetical protein
MKLRTELRDPQRTKKTCFLCRTDFRRRERRQGSIQPFDLMSRRHPLSSVGLSEAAASLRGGSSFELQRRAGIKPPASSSGEERYFFFFATLRVFFAVFFTALFAFLAFFAFLAMLPS